MKKEDMIAMLRAGKVKEWNAWRAQMRHARKGQYRADDNV